MDLALEFGMPVEQLMRSMTERELAWWIKRAQRKWLPAQRFEWYLARITQAIAVTMGGAKEAPLSEFMLELDPVTEDEPDVEEIRLAFGFNPYPRKK